MTNDVEQGTDKGLIARSRKIKRLIGAACLLVVGLAFSVVYLFRSSDSGVTITAFYALLLFIVIIVGLALGLGALATSLFPYKLYDTSGEGRYRPSRVATTVTYVLTTIASLAVFNLLIDLIFMPTRG